MTFNKFLMDLNNFDVSELCLEQLELLKKSLSVKTGCVNYYARVAEIRRDSEKHEE